MPRLDEPMTLDELPELVTVDELQRVLRVGRSTAYQIARRYRVPELGKRILRVRRSDVERIVRGEPERAPLRVVR